jgi:hypothetical protein
MRGLEIMRFDCSENGDLIVDADFLSVRLCLAVDELNAGGSAPYYLEVRLDCVARDG